MFILWALNRKLSLKFLLLLFFDIWLMEFIFCSEVRLQFNPGGEICDLSLYIFVQSFIINKWSPFLMYSILQNICTNYSGGTNPKITEKLYCFSGMWFITYEDIGGCVFSLRNPVWWTKHRHIHKTHKNIYINSSLR